MSNPFDDASGTFVVLVNSEGQHSLWPRQIDAPAGWDQAFGPADRAACLTFVTENWTDIRPRSLTRLDAGAPGC